MERQRGRKEKNNDVLELRRNRTHALGVFNPQVSFAPGKLGTLGAVSLAFKGELEAHNQVLVSTPFTSSATYRIYVEVAGIPTSLVIDAGAAVTLLRTDIWDKIQRQKPSALNPWTGPKLVGADGRPLQVWGCKQLTVTIAGQKFESQVIIADSLTAEGILGLNFLQAHHCMIDLNKEVLVISKRNLLLPLESVKKVSSTTTNILVCLTSTLWIPAQSEIEVVAHAPTTSAREPGSLKLYPTNAVEPSPLELW